MASINIRRTNQQIKGKNAWLMDYLKGNLIMSISAFVTFLGLCSVYAYHLHIEYFPFFGIQSLAGMIFAVAYIGIVSLIGLVVIFYLPAIYMGPIYKKSMVHGHNGASISQVGSRLTFLSSLGFVGWACFIYFGVEFDLSAFNGFCLLFVIFISHLLFNRSFMRMEMAWRQQGTRWFRVKNCFIGELPVFGSFLSWMTIYFFQFFPIFIFVFIISDDPDFQKYDVPKLFWAGIFLIVSQWYLVISWINGAIKAKHRVFSVLSTLLTSFVITFFCGNPAFIFTSIAHTTKIGNFYATELTLTKKGCNVFAGEGSKFCEEKGLESFKICGAYVMSRFGSETYLKVNYANVDGHRNSSKPKETPKASPVPTASVNPDPNAESKAQAIADAKNFRNIFLPSSDIIGMKVDMKVKHFNVAAINKFLRATNAMCPAPAKIEKVKSVTFKDIELFEKNKHAITLQGEKKLATLIKKIGDEKRKIAAIKIIGYADQEGSASANFVLSQMRALAVENFFRNNLPTGTTPINIYSQGVGSTRLNKTDVDCPLKMKNRNDCLAENRRVDIEFMTE